MAKVGKRKIITYLLKHGTTQNHPKLPKTTQTMIEQVKLKLEIFLIPRGVWFPPGYDVMSGIEVRYARNSTRFFVKNTRTKSSNTKRSFQVWTQDWRQSQMGNRSIISIDPTFLRQSHNLNRNGENTLRPKSVCSSVISFKLPMTAGRYFLRFC